jgi:hypothetical protein
MLREMPEIETDVFEQHIEHIMEADEEYLQDNCIAEVKPVIKVKPKKQVKMVSRRT